MNPSYLVVGDESYLNAMEDTLTSLGNPSTTFSLDKGSNTFVPHGDFSRVLIHKGVSKEAKLKLDGLPKTMIDTNREDVGGIVL